MAEGYVEKKNFIWFTIFKVNNQIHKNITKLIAEYKGAAISTFLITVKKIITIETRREYFLDTAALGSTCVVYVGCRYRCVTTVRLAWTIGGCIRWKSAQLGQD